MTEFETALRYHGTIERRFNDNDVVDAIAIDIGGGKRPGVVSAVDATFLLDGRKGHDGIDASRNECEPKKPPSTV